MPLSGLDQVPIYHNVYNGELVILSTPIDIRTVSYHIQGKISPSMICSLSFRGCTKEKDFTYKFYEKCNIPII